MKIILIGNYSKDKQESMNRFAQMLYSGYSDLNIETEIWLPDIIFARWVNSTRKGLGKWLGYLDKWVVFPIKLKVKLLSNKYNAADVHFHICDHSNAIYINSLPIARTIVTCHDVLAIRGALGHSDAYCPASGTGKILQKWILNSLSKTKFIASVSNFTLKQLKEIAKTDNQSPYWKVIYNSFNEVFEVVDSKKSTHILKSIGIEKPYILHIGSNLLRKNRKSLLDMIHHLENNYNGNLCFAGQNIDEELLNYAINLKLEKRLISIIGPDHDTLLALYNNCDAFIFPSFSEGFGWPIIEAQSCGAPVIASDIESLREIGANGALYADPNKPQEFAKLFLKLLNTDVKNTLIKAGFDNCKRFKLNDMLSSYIALHIGNC
jgi:glycosyltransferase involved in cell wall biosynthesis